MPHLLQQAGNLFSVFFVDPSVTPVVTDYAAAKTQAAYRFGPFFHSMLDQGVSLPPSAFEAWFVSAAHDDLAPRAGRRCAARRRPSGGPRPT